MIPRTGNDYPLINGEKWPDTNPNPLENLYGRTHDAPPIAGATPHRVLFWKSTWIRLLILVLPTSSGGKRLRLDYISFWENSHLKSCQLLFLMRVECGKDQLTLLVRNSQNTPSSVKLLTMWFVTVSRCAKCLPST